MHLDQHFETTATNHKTAFKTQECMFAVKKIEATISFYVGVKFCCDFG
jgi:hypothetical protein